MAVGKRRLSPKWGSTSACQCPSKKSYRKKTQKILGKKYRKKVDSKKKMFSSSSVTLTILLWNNWIFLIIVYRSVAYTMRLHYNAVLYNADSIITWSPRGSKYFSSILCVKMSANDRGIHNSSCENRTPCVFPSQVWHQLIFPKAVLTNGDGD